ncbi:MAG TPA: fibronectin type III domain-containing protein [Gaiellaceae bacterium]|nr:fibronectin type III domain-containing protein [Gaiellaceae bacterium]
MGLTLTAALLVLGGSMPAGATGSSPTMYVVGSGSSTVTPVDLLTNTAGAAIAVGPNSHGIAITPDGKTAYVASCAGNSVTPISTATNVAGAAIAVGSCPSAVAITPDGQTAYVSSQGSNISGQEGTTVTPIDTATNTAGTAITVGLGPQGIAITPDGQTAYVANELTNTVTPINTATNTAGTAITVGSDPGRIAITPDGKTAYVTNVVGDSVTPIDTATNTAGTAIAVGATPVGIAITPDGKTAYVANEGSNTVTPITTATNTAGTAIAVGGNPIAIAIAPDGKTAYVTNEGSNTVTPIDTATNTAGTAISVGTAPVAVAIAPDQAPVAALAVTAAPAFQTTVLDASASSVAFGSIASYAWDFGDGHTATTTSPTTGHAYQNVGVYAATVTETDSAGTSKTQVFTGQTVSRNGSAHASIAATIVIQHGPPGAPTGVSASAGDGQATVTFTAPRDDGSGDPISRYTVTASPGGATASGNASPIVVTGLTNGTAYTFTVTATNSVGTGPASTASNSATPFGPPGAPTDVSATAGDGRATISFTASADNGRAIVGYTVTASPGGATASDAGSPISVTGLTNGTAYTFTVTATNSLGMTAASAPSNSVTPAGLPGAPTDVSATAGDSQATVAFTAPADNGSAITSYTVTASPGGSSASGSASPVVVTGLSDGTAYTFTVTATNGVGEGAPSTASTDVTPVGPPGAPADVSALRGDEQASISFTGPADNGSPISSYTVTASPGGATASGSASPIAVTGLTNGTAYTFTVTATNGVGTGPASAASSAVTPAGLPQVPTGVSATAGDGQATVAFTAPADNGSAITSYTVTASPGGASASGDASPIVVTGLTNGTPYSFTVTATNGVGTGSTSAASSPATPAGLPQAPSAVSATASDGQAAVSFTSPSDNGSSIIGYTVTASPGGQAATGSSSPVTVGGLTDGTAYTFTVAATNGVGTGPASAASNSVTPAGLPGAPTDVSAVGGDRQATIVFTAPADNGSPISSYMVTASPGGATASGSASPLVVTGLTDGTAYTFTVAATNGVGTGQASTASNSVVPVGPADARRSTLTPVSSAIAANGSSTQVLTVQTKDAGGNDVTHGGATVAITKLSGSGSLGSIIDEGDGTYTAAVTASASAGSGVFVATVDGEQVESGTGTQTLATVHYVGQPAIANFSPTSGPAGATVTLSGSNFTGASGVAIGGAPAASFTVVSDSMVTVVLGAGASGTLSVTGPGGTGTSSGRFTFSPTIGSFTPDAGPIGTSVRIFGSGFGGATAVKFAGVDAAGFHVDSDSQITATVATGTTTGQVSVTVPGGTTTSGALFYLPPTITGFNPGGGGAHATVTVNGTNLTGATDVKLDGRSAPFSVVSATKLTFTVPAGASSGTIRVITPGGSDTTVGLFTVSPSSTITSVSPGSGPVGASVTITGTDLGSTIGVEIGGILTVPTSVSPTSVTFTVPPGATSGRIKVLTTGGLAVSTGTFTVTS